MIFMIENCRLLVGEVLPEETDICCFPSRFPRLKSDVYTLDVGYRKYLLLLPSLCSMLGNHATSIRENWKINKLRSCEFLMNSLKY